MFLNSLFSLLLDKNVKFEIFGAVHSWMLKINFHIEHVIREFCEVFQQFLTFSKIKIYSYLIGPSINNQKLAHIKTI